MQKKIRQNVVGKRFNKLLVLSQFTKDNKDYCNCKCDCGKETIVEYWNLITGHTSSCGCLTKNQEYDNIIGRRFGKLIVKEFLSKTKNEHNKYLCKCDCGREVEVLGVNLLYDQTKSCGCLYKASSYTRKIPISNKSGVKGVYFDKFSKKWVAYVSIKGKKIKNSFPKFEDAVRNRKELEEEYYQPIIEKYQ